MTEPDLLKWSAYATIPVVMTVYAWYKQRRTTKNQKLLNEAAKAGLTEPASLHPIMDARYCVGCGACVTACPEGNVIGLIHGKAQLINPSHCIGHGACKKACPFDAITLVFGSATRGIDIPHLNPNFETNVPGIFIAGELGGMGLIRNAIEQGRQAVEHIAKLPGIGKEKDLDVVIVGAGPAGFSATLAAKERKLRYLTLEQDSLGGTVFKFPRGKLVMTAPVNLPIIGKVKFRETQKEALLSFWQKIEERTEIKINYKEKLDNLERDANGFIITTTKDKYRTRAVLLCIGRRGTPRKLGVSGEYQPKVVYNLIDPEQYRGQHVLVVGGGDAALEAATSIVEEPDTTVILSYRSDSFSRAKEKNRQKLRQAEANGRLKVMLSSNVQEILKDRVIIEQYGKIHEFANDAVIICAGGILPTAFLKQIGIQVETKYGTA